MRKCLILRFTIPGLCFSRSFRSSLHPSLPCAGVFPSLLDCTAFRSIALLPADSSRSFDGVTQGTRHAAGALATDVGRGQQFVPCPIFQAKAITSLSVKSFFLQCLARTPVQTPAATPIIGKEAVQFVRAWGGLNLHRCDQTPQSPAASFGSDQHPMQTEGPQTSDEPGVFVRPIAD